MSVQHRFLAAVVAAVSVVAIPLPSQAEPSAASPLAIDPVPGSAWITDGGEVWAAARDSDTLYLGGSFTYVGPNTGGGGRVDLVTGSAADNPPYVEGGVTQAVGDGQGGFYVAGSGLRAIEGVVVDGLAHIRADGRLDRLFRPQLNGAVTALAKVGDTLYLGGDFTTYDTASRAHLAAIDVASGELLSWTRPVDGAIRDMSLSGSTLYVTGPFTSIDGQPRRGLAAVDVTSGAITPWDPQSGNVSTIAATPEAVYVGGAFTYIGGQPRRYLAALDPVTGLATSWIPTSPHAGASIVRELATDGTNLYVGTIDRLFALPLADPAGTAWWLSTGSQQVGGLLLDGGRLYVTGSFTTLGTTPRRYVGAVTPATGAVLPWNPSTAASASAVAVSGDTVYLGGRSPGGVTRNRVAAISMTTGRPTSWNPGADQPVESLAVGGGSVYLGGYFANVAGQPRSRLAAVDQTTGAARDWRADASDPVRVLALKDGVLYAGGAFATVGGANRSRVAALDAATGSVLDWSPTVSGGAVLAIAPTADQVYLGGLFTSVNGAGRAGLAAVGRDGVLTPWNPGIAGTATATTDNTVGAPVVRALVVEGGTTYVGGDFDSLGGVQRASLAAVDAGSGVVRSWSGQASGSVHALAVSGSELVAGGTFTSLGSARSHRGLAAFDLASGAESEWTPVRDPSDVRALAVAGRSVVAAGYFYVARPLAGDHQRRDGFAVLDTELPTTWALPTIDGETRIGAAVSCGDGLEWTGQPSSLAWQWYVDDVPVAGATSSTYTIPEADAEHELRCAMTATNGAGPTTRLGTPSRVWSVEESAATPSPTPSATPSPTPTATSTGGDLLGGLGGTTSSPSGTAAPSTTAAAVAPTTTTTTPTATATTAAALPALTLGAPRVTKYASKVVLTFGINRTAALRLRVKAPNRRFVLVASKTAAAGTRTIAWNKYLYGAPARRGVTYTMVLSAAAGGRTVYRTVYVRF